MKRISPKQTSATTVALQEGRHDSCSNRNNIENSPNLKSGMT
ncbi:hypothetical protein [Gibbsiella quercinecans]|nr:hypothetical protein [Gibbsiella quercinecans]